MAHETPPPPRASFASYLCTRLALLAVLLGLTPSNALAAAGDVDSLNLNVQGPVNAVVNATAVQLDGKIIIAGYFTNVLGVTRRNLARLNGDGTLDTTFTNGTDFPILSMALDSRRIVIAGVFTKVVNPSGGTVTNRHGLAGFNY